MGWVERYFPDNWFDPDFDEDDYKGRLRLSGSTTRSRDPNRLVRGTDGEAERMCVLVPGRLYRSIHNL